MAQRAHGGPFDCCITKSSQYSTCLLKASSGLRGNIVGALDSTMSGAALGMRQRNVVLAMVKVPRSVCPLAHCLFLRLPESGDSFDGVDEEAAVGAEV